MRRTTRKSWTGCLVRVLIMLPGRTAKSDRSVFHLLYETRPKGRERKKKEQKEKNRERDRAPKTMQA